MPTARQANAGERKRQKTVAAIHFDAAECVSYDALVDLDYPIDRIEEHLLRLLSYEPAEGIAEVLALAVRSIGCSVEFQLTGVGAALDEIVSEVDALEDACLTSATGCPSRYDMQRAEYAKRARALISSATEKLEEAGNADVVVVLAKYTAMLATLRLQSLRFTGTLFSGCMLRALSERGPAYTALSRVLIERAADVAPVIRRAAILELGATGDLATVARAFNDAVGSVRLAAVRAVATSPEPSLLEDAAWNRLAQIAQQDTELGVRRVALKLLAAHGTGREIDLVGMLADPDVQSRNTAAVFVTAKLAAESESPAHLLVSLATTAGEVLDSTHRDIAAAALAHGLDKQKSKYSVSWLKEIGDLLTRDLLKEARIATLSPATKKLYRELAHELDNTDTRRRVLVLYAALAAAAGSSSSVQLLDSLPRVIVKVRYDDDLLAIAIAIVPSLAIDNLAEQADSELKLQALLRQILELLSERPATSVALAASAAFSAIPEVQRDLLLKDAFHDLRLKLATLLGPRGEVSAQRRDEMDHVIMELLVLSRFIDISALAKLPLWPLLTQENQKPIQLVRAMGLKGNAELANQCIERLASLPSGPAVDVILQIHISAKMRGIDLQQIPFDINENPPQGDAVWTAAVAAGVI